jgi:hypothetical protein
MGRGLAECLGLGDEILKEIARGAGFGDNTLGGLNTTRNTTGGKS